MTRPSKGISGQFSFNLSTKVYLRDNPQLGEGKDRGVRWNGVTRTQLWIIPPIPLYHTLTS